MKDLTRRTIGRYEVGPRLGRGGMGQVYKAHDTKLKRAVALKLLPPELSADQSYARRLLREAQHAASLNHPCIASIYDVLEVDGELLLVMEHVEGTTLRHARTPIPIDAFMDIALQCAEALVAAHAKGIIHRDIKPDNIMLTPDRKVKVLDFGIARQQRSLEDSTTETMTSTLGSTTAGTPAYMSPEAHQGRHTDHRVDIFSLGLVFYEMTTGRRAFQGATFSAVADEILNKDPVAPVLVNPSVPEELERITLKMIAKEPSERFDTATDLLVDLQRLRRERDRATRPSRAGHRRRRAKARSVQLLAGAVGVAALAVLVSPALRGYFGQWLLRPSLPDPANVAVLPLTAADGDIHDAAFARGLSESLARRLTPLTSRATFAVVAPGFIRARRVTVPDQIPPQVGGNLALAGTFQRSGRDALVQLELLEPESGRVLRRRNVAAPFADPMSLEHELVVEVLGMLDIDPGTQSHRSFTRYGTENATAYHAYLRGLGHLYSDSDDENAVDRAIESFREAVDLHPGFSEARAQLGVGYWQRFLETAESSWKEEARRHCQQAEWAEETLESACACLGAIAAKEGSLLVAQQRFERAHFLEPTDGEVLRGLVHTYRAMGRFDDIERTYRVAVDLRPHYWRNYVFLGTHLFRQSRFADAAVELERGLELAPRYYRSLNTLGAAYSELGMWDDAMNAYEASLAVHATGIAYTNLATTCFYRGSYSRAVELFETAIIFMEREKRLNFTLYGNLADALYWAPGERDKSLAHYRRALEMAQPDLARDSTDVLALGRVALYHAMLGEREQALGRLGRALTIGPEHAETLFKAALIHQQLGDVDESYAFLERALEKGTLASRASNHPVFRQLRQEPRYRELFASN